MHRWDAEGVDGAGAALPADLAEDGVPEFMEIMVGSDLASPPGAVTLTATGCTLARAGAVAGTGGDRAPARCLEDASPGPRTWSSCSTGACRSTDAAMEGDPVLVAALLSLADTEVTGLTFPWGRATSSHPRAGTGTASSLGRRRCWWSPAPTKRLPHLRRLRHSGA